ncbi:CDP-diacylglycerol--glycerol-3-phosphate 3-phosphatidyltransferase [Candidatus Mycoplasma pogonae]
MKKLIDLKTMKFKNLPNILTILRIVLVIPFIAFLIVFYYLGNLWAYWLTFGIFVVAIFTDFLDGYLARKFKTVSNFGKIFDPIGDKILINTTLIFFAAFTTIPVYIVVLFILRDITVDGVRIFYASQKIEVAASKWGKLKTLTQTFAIMIIFIFSYIIFEYSNDQNFNTHYWVLQIPVFIALFFSFFSAYFYLKSLWKLLKTN